MAYDETVADQIRKALRRRRGISEKKMFGGIAFMLHGNMCCGVIRDNLVLRLGEDEASKALSEPHTGVMDFTGRPLKSMIYIRPAGYRSYDDLQAWINRAFDFVKTLPKKQ